ncbi:bifunctional 2-C-methyl-D-erythritol 4-phosphate cytidylyltransferase/2-C-methyl-D-erythritol 2,4-cyclodiphosphate synthase [Neomegalonema perideroedes]|uniref:bifunctional 2-C-methyl-D-erythritol 4-phosphate cytidylyltransferase/2-C-methyl-D-erythritol 2,4-cyclodiphosphate synthase n=1 Tax=Neomegalonema perideroedes TaxID=217219 RepID=UPI00047711C8|nr:bifunctional 2-C-methyl-D-erythritol 4-phosphate cytidylyltransferase/2-C-methyl-D-erythritol 2,4-cyclodiphosphate synthase [Neomegalonema perideroedes]
MRIAALIVAAGRGARMQAQGGGGEPKQYLRLAGRSLLRRALEAFAAHPRVSGLQLVIRPGDEARAKAEAEGLPKILPFAAGGAERQDSVLAGLEALAPQGFDLVLIHDAARPFVSEALISRVIAALEAGEAGALPALPVADALWREDGAGGCGEPVPRAGLWRAQTPQGFRLPEILAAHRAAQGLGLLDDAEAARRAGLAVRLVAGEEANGKITHPQDFAAAEARLAQKDKPMEFRFGQGYDVHRFASGDHVMLGGVRAPHDQGVEAHSDGDVVLHALTDAILGALAMGDIGRHFPPSDPQWKGASSDRFLAHAVELAAREGWRLNNADVTVVCERPKIAPHAAAMRARIAEICGSTPDRVSVKATTNEGMGFAGRGEGLAALAVASLIRGV